MPWVQVSPPLTKRRTPLLRCSSFGRGRRTPLERLLCSVFLPLARLASSATGSGRLLAPARVVPKLQALFCPCQKEKAPISRCFLFGRGRRTTQPPSCGSQNLLRLGAPANFDRCAILASLHLPPAAHRRRCPARFVPRVQVSPPLTKRRTPLLRCSPSAPAKRRTPLLRCSSFGRGRRT